MADHQTLSWADSSGPARAITWFAQGTLYRLRASATGEPPLLYATGPDGYARVTKARLTDDEVATWARLPPAERTARAARWFAP
jgi:hypothetical protein